MGSYKTQGIVLARHNLGEADRIVTFLTPDRGKVRAVARGVRKIKSRMAGHLELFSRTELMLAEGRNLDIITSARLQQYHEPIAVDYDRLRGAYLRAEMVDRLMGDAGGPHPDVFRLLSDSLRELAEQGATPLLELSYKLKLADALGYRPELAACTSCGGRVATDRYFLNAAHGGIVDSACSQPGDPAMSQRQIKLWRVLLVSTPDRDITIEPELATEGLSLSNYFYDYVFGRTFRSAQVLAI
jgi:DNA repair protein RecO (recombination protein O)